MNHARKLASLLLALIMVFALATTAFAAENTTISAPKGSTRTYDVYQIFTGDLYNGVLSNVKWGQNSTATVGDAVDQTILDCHGIGVVFPFPDITIVEEKGSADYFRFFRFPFPCT